MAEGGPQDAVAVDIGEESVDFLSHQTQSSHEIPQQCNQSSLVLNPDWVASIERRCQERKLKKASIADRCSISRVSAAFKESDELSFRPQTISIGPIYRRTLDDEDHKWSYLHAILDRQEEGCLMKYLAALKQTENEARECYKTDINVNMFDSDSDSFVEMMLLDGCLVIELFSKAMDGDCEDDPLLYSEWTMKNVARDLILLENQIPFLVLQHLFDMMNIGCGGLSLAERALRFFGKYLKIRSSYDPKFHPQHLLDLLHHCCFPLSHVTRKTNIYVGTIPSATELKRAGIKFKKGNAECLFDIKFQKGVIEISPFTLDDHACSLFCNFLAFEQCYRSCHKNIMMYIHLMECLIDTPGDFEILTRNEIICNNLGVAERVIGFFKRLVNQVALSDRNDYLKDVCYGINQYYNTTFRRCRASLVRIFQKNPWVVVSVAAAIILQLLILLQRIYMPNKN